MRRPTRNEYGVKLDKNGYAPSLFPHESFRCFSCGRFGETARHEIFGGSRRSASKALGLWVNVCPACHNAIHASGELQDQKIGENTVYDGELLKNNGLIEKIYTTDTILTNLESPKIELVERFR